MLQMHSRPPGLDTGPASERVPHSSQISLFRRTLEGAIMNSVHTTQRSQLTLVSSSIFRGQRTSLTQRCPVLPRPQQVRAPDPPPPPPPGGSKTLTASSPWLMEAGCQGFLPQFIQPVKHPPRRSTLAFLNSHIAPVGKRVSVQVLHLAATAARQCTRVGLLRQRTGQAHG